MQGKCSQFRESLELRAPHTTQGPNFASMDKKAENQATDHLYLRHLVFFACD